ncbi:MAG: DUF3108 domain-containing protein [Acidobacteria bacterium]|jgi:hypothetical protein|nr:DUF3108 domain-containing protein [Acidobacteriota bacterium]
MKKLIYSLLIIFSVACVSIFAQISGKITPYKAGETLAYEGKFSKLLLRGIEVAVLSLTVENAPNSQNYLVKSEAKSQGTLAKLFGFDFQQDIQSTINGENFSVLKTIKRDEQGDRVRESEAVFDYRGEKVTYIETDPNDMARPPRRVASPIEKDTQDLITSIYLIRRLPLAVGKTFELNISDSGLVYKIPVRVTAREQKKSILGKTWCFRVEPEVFGKNRLIEQEGSLILWITDDARRLPVRAQIDFELGKIEVKLRQINYNPPVVAKAK